jgi:hypothetical protein
MELSEQPDARRVGIFLAMHGSKDSEISLQAIAKREILK